MSLEKIISEEHNRREEIERKRRIQISKTEALENRKKKIEFRKNFKLLFANFGKETKITFDKFNDHHAIFQYKGNKYSIAFESWFIEGTGVDGYDTSGFKWALHRWCGGWPGEGHRIVDLSQVDYKKDYSKKAIEILAEISKDK